MFEDDMRQMLWKNGFNVVERAFTPFCELKKIKLS